MKQKQKKAVSTAASSKAVMTRGKLLVVQFPHPGVEAVPTMAAQKSNPSVMAWNNSAQHKRKFMKATGQIVNINGTLSPKQDLLFWGEWEPTSMVYPITQWQGNGVQPQWLHIPFLNANAAPAAGGTANTAGCGGCVPTPYGGINTDPLVFGDYFIYSNCKQTRKNKGIPEPTQMQYLLPGSIILFGSKLLDSTGTPYFGLDTVFVVGDSRPYQPCNYKTDLKGFVPPDFARIMGPSFMKIKTQFTCYHGATVNNPIEGMFSFVPCKPYPNANIGFPRVKLTDKDFAQFAQYGNIIINGLSRIYHYTVIPNLQTSRSIWGKVCNIIQQQGYERGVNLRY